MKENTQEKKLMKKNENSILYKIKNFFMKLFNKKDKAVEEVTSEQTSTYKNNSGFKDDIKVPELDEARILEIQQRYRNGDINLNELTNEEIDKLCDLYDEQINELQKKIESKRGMIEEYRKRKQYRFKKNNA